MFLQTVVSLLVLVVGCFGVVRDGQYYQDLCFRLTGNSISWPNAAVKENFTESGKFIPRNVMATSFQAWRDQIFVVTPKFKSGVPFTLSKFDILQRSFPLLQPFPSWEVQQESTPSAIHNVVDTFIDSRDILWVLDVGITCTLSSWEKKGPPKVVAFDALSGRVIHTIDLASLTCSDCRLQYILVDYCPRTGTPWVYVSDATSRTILVYDVAKSRGHRVVLPEVVNPDGPNDVLYMVLITRFGRPTRVYFTYLSSNGLFSITADDLQNATNNGTVMDEGRKPAPMIVLGSVDNNIYFRYKGKPNIFMWNVDTTFRESNFIPVQDFEEDRLATQVAQGYGGMLWMMEGNLKDFLKNTTGCLGANVLIHPVMKP